MVESRTLDSSASPPDSPCLEIVAGCWRLKAFRWCCRGSEPAGARIEPQIHPSRLVAILDNLEKWEFVERSANPDDRRLYSLYLTKDGGEVLERIGNVAREHQDALLSVSIKRSDELANLMLKIADQHGLVRGVHPEYQRMGKSKAP
jgi:hypothetical protein